MHSLPKINWKHHIKINLLPNSTNRNLFSLQRSEILFLNGEKKWTSSAPRWKHADDVMSNTLGRKTLNQVKRYSWALKYFYITINLHLLRYIYCFIACTSISLFESLFCWAKSECLKSAFLMNSSRALLEPGVHVPIVEVNCSKLLL